MIMSKKVLTIGIVLMLGVLVAGAVAMWVLPDRAEARYGGGRGPAGDGTGLAVTAGGTGSGYRGEAGTGYRGGYGRSGSSVAGGQGAGLSDGCAIVDGPVGSLSEAEASALRTALADEYAAKALYEQAMADLGSVRPLTSIERAEEQHIAALERLFSAYGLEIPAEPVDGQDLTFATLADACATGVSVETANAALYDGLLAQVDNPDLVRVFTALQSASQTRHLPALEACAQ
jgi:hypothetical protein